eukprot:g16064.t1
MADGMSPFDYQDEHSSIPILDYWRFDIPLRKDQDMIYWPTVNSMEWPYGTKGPVLNISQWSVPSPWLSAEIALRPLERHRAAAAGVSAAAPVPRGAVNATGALLTVAAVLGARRWQRLRLRAVPAQGEDGSKGKVLEVRAGRIRLKTIFLGNPLNVMLVFTPLGLASQSLGWGEVATFGLCFLAIVPLAKLLGEATEQLSCSVGQTLGGLLNATFGNAVEMIISVFALREGLTEVVKGSLVGSIISNLLLVLGMCFFFGGLNYQTQRFNANGARTQYSLLLLAILALVIPTVVLLTGVRPESELLISRGCAIVLAVLYICYLIFQLVTHKDEFAAAETEDDCEEEAEPSLSPGTAVALLVAATLLVAPLSEALTGSVEGVTKTLNISDAFVGVVLLPIVGNAAEHLTAVTVATKDKMDLSLGVALGSSTQIALFVVPFTVIIGWILGVPMDLNFRSLDVSILLLTVLIVGSTIVDDAECPRHRRWHRGLSSVLSAAILHDLGGAGEQDCRHWQNVGSSRGLSSDLLETNLKDHEMPSLQYFAPSCLMAEKKSRWGRKEKKAEAVPVLEIFKDSDHRDRLEEPAGHGEECGPRSPRRSEGHGGPCIRGRDSGAEVATVDEPRRTLFMSDPGICYEYSGRENMGQTWHPAVLEIKRKAEEGLVKCGLPEVIFNSAQMNRYDFPRHTLGMHADNEPDLDRDAPIVSVSFGATRDFVIQDRANESLKWVVTLADGAWFVMGGAMQQQYLHGVPHGGMAGTRINLTFRVCRPRADLPRRPVKMEAAAEGRDIVCLEEPSRH